MQVSIFLRVGACPASAGFLGQHHGLWVRLSTENSFLDRAWESTSHCWPFQSRCSLPLGAAGDREGWPVLFRSQKADEAREAGEATTGIMAGPPLRPVLLNKTGGTEGPTSLWRTVFAGSVTCRGSRGWGTAHDFLIPLLRVYLKGVVSIPVLSVSSSLSALSPALTREPASLHILRLTVRETKEGQGDSGAILRDPLDQHPFKVQEKWEGPTAFFSQCPCQLESYLWEPNPIWGPPLPGRKSPPKDIDGRKFQPRSRRELHTGVPGDRTMSGWGWILFPLDPQVGSAPPLTQVPRLQPRLEESHLTYISLSFLHL